MGSIIKLGRPRAELKLQAIKRILNNPFEFL
jgi:hypothetical protein